METGKRSLSYYEDFGLPSSASPEQIRETFRILVRLLHPDHQTDPVLQRAADGQMRRILRAYAVLSDPEQRRLYDAELHAPPERPTPVVIRTPNAVVVRTRLQRGHLLWMGAAIVSLGTIFWLATEGQSSPVFRKVSAQDADPVKLIENSRQLVNRPVGRRAAEQTTTRVPAQNPAPPRPLPEVQPMETPAPLVETSTFASPQLPAPAELAHVKLDRFAGFWAYPHEKNFQRQSGQYPPQFIEASIAEHEGVIRGKYRARYYVSDRPISPNVNFEFEGKIEGSAANLPWHGEGGSTGVMEIKLLSAEEMELIWTATDFGQTLGLASGKAVLMRRPE
jgi:curved DNA-binding protein CbpA